jgi:hypothetical protein
VIGERHIDNQPSKFFDYLGHQKPILVVGPQGNPIQSIIDNLGIGVYCDVRQPQSIQQGILRLSTQYGQFVRSYQDHDLEIKRYSARSVANQWLKLLDDVYANSQRDIMGRDLR